MVQGSLRFPDGFLWGVATSAYQIEGAVHEDGRGPSIWDTFSHTPGMTARGETGDVACDHYHRWPEDVALMAELGVQGYRFSVSWSRIQPEGRGPANGPGLDHYRRLVDAMVDRGIAPAVTLYHWDLPQALQDQGGWAERETALRFAEYAAIVGGVLGTAPRMWITVNEPWVAAWMGHATGEHAPGHRDPAEALVVTHHLLLAHGLAVQAIRASSPGGAPIGIALNLSSVVPESDAPQDVAAARRVDGQLNRLYLDPLFGRGYPDDVMDRYADLNDFGFVRDGDLDSIAVPLDFLGVNYYTRLTVAGQPPELGGPLPWDSDVWAVLRPDIPVTSMWWPIEPDGLFEVLLRLRRDYPAIPLYVTENGAAFDDRIGRDGKVEDADRIAFLDTHLRAAHRATAQAGVDLRGYFVWSLLDNFEWTHGYEPRFGIFYTDYGTQARTPKASAHWYRDVIARNGVAGSA